jgi:3-oxoacyl-[acyl-carrier-protein] synthase II
MEQYVITGIGIYNGLGPNAEISWQGLLDSKTAIKQLSWPEDDSTKFPSTHSSLKVKIAAKNTVADEYPDHFSYGWQHWDPNTRACLLTVDEAINDANLISKNVGVIISTFGSGTTLRLDVFSALNNGAKKVSPRKILNIGLDFPAAQVAAIYKVTGPNTSMDSACTTGITSIDYAINQLKANPELDAMIVGAADHMAEPIYLYWFQNLGALCLSDDVTASCPFDTARNGFVMGEGAATMIIEPLSKAQARGASIYGVVKSTSFITMFDSDTSPDPDGVGAKMCVEQALSKAGIIADDIDYINAHATSTPSGDQVEFNAMLAITPDRVMVSNKGQIGHAMSASGIVETIYSLLAMRDSRTPGNANLINPLGTGMILPTHPTNININHIIKNSFGFGGRNASIIIGKYHE